VHRLLLAVIAVTLFAAVADAARVRARPEPAAPATAPIATAQKTLVIGTRNVPPFAFKNGADAWQGISIDLWRDIAARLQLKYRFEEAATVKDLIDGVATKKFDAGVAAITVTEERQRRLDFSHPFFTTGLAIATAPSNDSPVWTALSAMFTWTWLAVALAVFAAIVAVGFLLWWVERKANAEMDKPSEGFWSSLTMLLTASFTAPEPRTALGRTLAALWVVISLVTLTFFTGVVTSALTVQSLQGRVRGVEDLPHMRVGSVGGSSGMQWLADERVRATSFANVADGLAAIAEGRIDAFVYDAPILQYMAQKEYKDRIVILPDNFGPQDYAFALPTESPHRRQINQELLSIKASDVWKKRLFEYLGER
jgi:ABC-type amino acid transport substrate-binding protein